MKLLIRRHLAGFLVIVTLAAPVQADILFLDLNNNPQEIERAERAAHARGERLRVIPTVNREAAAELKRATANAESARKELISCRSGGGSCDSQNQKVKDLEANQRRLSSQVSRLGPDLLASELKKMQSQGVNLTSVVMSGHHYNGRFWGLFGNLRDTDIKEAFDQVPSLRDGVQAMHLWGCYTTNLGALEYNWKNIFPKASIITGFDDLAPAGDRPANLDILEGTLLKERELVMAQEISDVTRILRDIPHAMDGSLSFQACLNGEEVTSFNGEMNIKEEIAKCQAMDNSAGAALYRCYSNAEENCPDIPTSTKDSELRSLYNHLQATRHCDSVLSADGQTRVTADHVIRLIHDRSVRANFEAIHESELRDLNSLLDKVGIDQSIRFSNLADMTRGEFIGKVQALSEAYKQALHARVDADGLMDDADVAAIQPYLSVFKALSNPECVPETWMDRGSSNDSPCDLRKYMREAKQFGKDFASFTGAQRQVLGLQKQTRAGAEQLKWQREYTKLVRSLEESSLSASERRKIESDVERVKERYWALEAAAVREAASQALVVYQRELERLQATDASPDIINMVRKKIQDVRSKL